MKRLRLLLLPAGAGLVLWLSLTVSALNSLMLVSMACLPFLLGFAIQGNVLAFSRQRLRWLRLVSLVPLLLLIAQSVYETSRKGMLWQLEVFFLDMAAVLYLIGWSAAWALEAKDHA